MDALHNVMFFSTDDDIVPSLFFEVGNFTEFIISDLQCVGNESRITDCPFNDLPNCAESEAVGLICRPQDLPSKLLAIKVTITVQFI